MSPRSRRVLAVLILLLLGVLGLLLIRCSGTAAPELRPTPAPVETTPAQPPETPATPATGATPAGPDAEVLTPATVQVPGQVLAGAAFPVEWTGPDNRGDYLTIVRPDTRAADYGNYVETRAGSPLELTAPLEPGEFEVRYVAVRSKTILGRAPIVVTPVTASLDAPAEAALGTPVSVSWSGPDNAQDYITIVAKGTPDGRYGNYAETRKGSPLTITAPVEPGEAELRYMTGQGAKVLARRDLRIIAAKTSITAPAEVIAGTKFEASWTGPDNSGDYLTIVPKDTPDGRYKNYTETRNGPTLQITALIDPGEAELRYMTGQGSKVLARRSITVVPAKITLDAPAEAVAGSTVPVSWTGPNNSGDYLTIVAKDAPDGQFARYADASWGTPAKIMVPAEPGAAEIRYMSGQGAKVLARRKLTVVPE